MSHLQIAVIGAGHLGRIHARLLTQIEGVELVAIADPCPSVQRGFIEETDVQVVSDYRKIMDQFDAAVIATPTRRHFEVAEELLSNSKHVLIEKPITACPYQANQLVELAEENGCVLSVGHVEQFNPAIQAALAVVGQPKLIQACRASGYTYRSTDIGAVYDLMIHDIDLVNTAFPGELVQTHASGFTLFGGHEDMAHAQLQFSCGGVATLTASRCSFNAERSIRIYGTDGFAIVDLASHQVQSVRFPQWLKDQEFDFNTANAEQREYIKENLFTEILPLNEAEPARANAILDEQRDWLDCIQTGSSMRNTGRNAAEAVRIAGQVLDQIESSPWGNASPDILQAIPFDSFSNADKTAELPGPLADSADVAGRRVA